VGEFRGVTRNGFVQFTASCEGVDLFWGLLKAKHAISLRRVYGDFPKENNWKVLGNCDRIEIECSVDARTSESEISGRGAAEAQKQARCTLHFLGDRMNYKAKDIITFFK
jgi:hypothetical protein